MTAQTTQANTSDALHGISHSLKRMRHRGTIVRAVLVTIIVAVCAFRSVDAAVTP